MDNLLEKSLLSFRDLERTLWQELRALFTSALEEFVELLDQHIFESRDKQRFKVLEICSKVIETLVGPVQIRRRVYWDYESEQRVYLLDQALELAERIRIGPGLAVALANLGVTGPSYREARETATALFGERVASHETIRQVVKQTGKVLETLEERMRDHPKGKRKVPILFVEVDGLWVSLQGERRSSREVRTLTSHEGWQPRHPGSAEYELVNKHHFSWSRRGGDFWDEASRFLAAYYDLDETLVIINGDRAGWIRRGVEYFPKAIYQVDRFHLFRDLKILLKDQPEKHARAVKAVKEGDTGTFFAVLAEGLQATPDRKKKEQLRAFLNDLITIPDSVIDYRLRLAKRGLATDGLRGMGAAESEVDCYSNRIKKRGQSWSLDGLQMMMACLKARFEGRLEKAAEMVERTGQVLSRQQMQEKASRIVSGLVSKIGVRSCAE